MNPRIRKAIVLSAICIIAVAVQIKWGVFPAMCVAVAGLLAFDRLRPKDEL